MVNSYSESIVDRLHSPTPPIPIAISSSQSPLLSVTPVRSMDTANFINVEVRVCYSFSKYNIFSAKAKELFVVVWINAEIRPENQQRISSTHLSKTLSLSLRTQRQCKMAWGKVAEVRCCYYSQDSREIVQGFPCMEVVKFTDGDRMCCQRRCFWMLRPAKG